jgi:hypothetical protein
VKVFKYLINVLSLQAVDMPSSEKCRQQYERERNEVKTEYSMAWEAFKDSQPNCFDIQTVGTLTNQYLTNRLRIAFDAGLLAGEQKERKRIMAGIEAVLSTTKPAETPSGEGKG